MQPPSTSFEVDDSARQNRVPTLLHQLNHNTKEAQEVEEMFQELDSLSVKSDKQDKEIFLELESNKEKQLSHEDQIKQFTESIKEGKTSPEILTLLIQKFEGEPAVATWVKNWRNFLKLHQLAQTKPQAEKAAIQQIIFSADFSQATAFDDSLVAIANHENISTQTKREIVLQFHPSDITSVDGLDSALQQLKSQQKSAENLLISKQEEQVALDNEIGSLEAELEELPANSPRRNELETEIKQKKERLQLAKHEFEMLKVEAKRKPVFPLRSGFVAELNSDGSRGIKILAENFTIQLPSHSLPFTTGKNLRGLNLAFVAAPLLSNHIADALFMPNLSSHVVPTKNQRQMGHFILDSLGFDDSRILDEREIRQVQTDLGRLVFSPLGKSGEERLAELGIYDVVSQKIDEKRLKGVLEIIRESRGVRDELFWEKLE